jgi:ribonucleoside-triphosphate reductase
MDVSEGLHRPLGQYVFNWVNFSHIDPITDLCARAGYRTMENPTDPNGKLVCFPVDYSGCRFETVGDVKVNREPAIQQLERYRHWNTLWTDHNSSITVSWDIEEIDDIVEWLYKYWHDYVAVSWMKRVNPLCKPEDIGYKYLPQEVVTPGRFRDYTKELAPVDWSSLHNGGVHDFAGSDCEGGVCPVK